MQATQARVEWLAGDLDAAAAELADARARIARSDRSLPQAGHGQALVEALSASLAAQAGDFEQADRWLASAYAAGIETTDMPIVAGVAVAAATWPRRAGTGPAPRSCSARRRRSGARTIPRTPRSPASGSSPRPPPTREAALARLRPPCQARRP